MRMNLRTILICAATLFVAAELRADALVASVQAKLKDQGFYYGEVTGQKDADTVAAIRRYQIRNGLKITGELNPETEKSLGVKGGTTATLAATPARTATPAPRPAAIPKREPVREEEVQPSQSAQSYDNAPAPRSVPDEEEFDADAGGVFDGTPYETAPPEVQRRVMIGAQTVLARRGYYRSGVDGVYGPGTAFALRAFQTRFELEPHGRLDLDTLGALGLLPGQQLPGVVAPAARRVPRIMTAPNGEPVYEPR